MFKHSNSKKTVFSVNVLLALYVFGTRNAMESQLYFHALYDVGSFIAL